MPLKVESLPVTKQFKLKMDPTGETFVVVRQATVGEQQQRYNLLAEVTFVVMRDQGGDQEIRQRINLYEQMRLDAFCSLSECNILGPDDTPLFKFRNNRARSQAEFNTAWDSMPPGWAEEIHRCVLDVNPDWDPTRGDFPPLE